MYLKEIRKIIVVKESKLKRFLILDDFGLKRVIPDIPSCNFEQTSQNKHPREFDQHVDRIGNADKGRRAQSTTVFVTRTADPVNALEHHNKCAGRREAKRYSATIRGFAALQPGSVLVLIIEPQSWGPPTGCSTITFSMTRHRVRNHPFVSLDLEKPMKSPMCAQILSHKHVSESQG
jgi:hypothetical protein